MAIGRLRHLAEHGTNGKHIAITEIETAAGKRK